MAGLVHHEAVTITPYSDGAIFDFIDLLCAVYIGLYRCLCVGADVIFVDAIRPSSGIQRSIVSLAAQQQHSRKEIKSKQQHAAGSIPSLHSTFGDDDAAAALCSNDKRHNVMKVNKCPAI